MAASLHIGKVEMSEFDQITPLIEERFVWFMVDDDGYYLGVCPAFDLVESGALLPTYDVHIQTLEDDTHRISFVRADADN